uniref:Uncharacterized protein n=1 Tax=Knipowitschia caucasica TaxID=637954 RepID=A0AAV2M6L2_KNICA
MFLKLPTSCKKIANQCCPMYQQVSPAAESPVGSEEDSYADWDCGLLASCKDASDCLELAMEAWATSNLQQVQKGWGKRRVWHCRVRGPSVGVQGDDGVALFCTSSLSWPHLLHAPPR